MAHPGIIASRNPDGIALVRAETGATLTWSQLHRRAVQTANVFHRRGLRPGDSIALCLENRFEFVSVVWAALYSGLRFTPISTRLLQPEVEYILADCGARALVHSGRTAVAAAAATAAAAARPRRSPNLSGASMSTRRTARSKRTPARRRSTNGPKG